MTKDHEYKLSLSEKPSLRPLPLRFCLSAVPKGSPLGSSQISILTYSSRRHERLCHVTSQASTTTGSRDLHLNPRLHFSFCILIHFTNTIKHYHQVYRQLFCPLSLDISHPLQPTPPRSRKEMATTWDDALEKKFLLEVAIRGGPTAANLLAIAEAW